ncbi:MAG TPA: hypothetical protein VE871_06880 [Longimicrobium sp.]|nr:hypothetical protein [Longimicrobium sp.]
MRIVSVQLRTSCSRCGSPLPLNALVPRLACPACSATNELDDEFWLAVLGDDDLGTCTILTAGREISLDVEKAGPACAECGADIPAKDALAAADAGSVACTACAARTLVRVPPPVFVLSGFQLLVGEDPLQVPAAGATLAVQCAVAQPVAFNCPTCGGVLQVDGSVRVVKCGYCQGAAYLPDGLWHVFHPVPVTRPWFLVRDPGARDRARRQARDPATEPARLDALSAHVDTEVREAVARHPRTPEATLLRMAAADESIASDVLENPSLSPAAWPSLVETGSGWLLERIASSTQAPPDVLRTVLLQVAHRLADDYAGDADALDASDVDGVLEALAENPHTPAEVLADVARLNAGRPTGERADLDEALAKHPDAPAPLLSEIARSEDRSARLAVAAHRRTPVSALESLVADPEWDVRMEVAKRPELSPETLKRLGRDEDHTVQHAARENPSYPRFNLFKKLFGG